MVIGCFLLTELYIQVNNYVAVRLTLCMFNSLCKIYHYKVATYKKRLSHNHLLRYQSSQGRLPGRHQNP